LASGRASAVVAATRERKRNVKCISMVGDVASVLKDGYCLSLQRTDRNREEDSGSFWGASDLPPCLRSNQGSDLRIRVQLRLLRLCERTTCSVPRLLIISLRLNHSFTRRLKFEQSIVDLRLRRESWICNCLLSRAPRHALLRSSDWWRT
jgi:hypothetical protein